MDADLISLETMIATQETARWTYWMMFATWFAGAATFMAVVTSLYVANRKPVPKFVASLSSGLIAPAGQTIQAVMIEVANVGLTPIVVSSITWEFGGKVKMFNFFPSPFSAKLPKKIEHGESAVFIIETPNYNGFLKQLKSDITKAQGKVDKLRISVALATQQKKKFKVDKNFHETLKNV